MPTRLQRAALALAISLALVDASAASRCRRSLRRPSAATKPQPSRWHNKAPTSTSRRGRRHDGAALGRAIGRRASSSRALLAAGAERERRESLRHDAAAPGRDQWRRRNIALLLAAGADANATLPEGETVLMTAARTGSAGGVATRCSSHGARLEARENWYGETPLIWAAAREPCRGGRACSPSTARTSTVVRPRRSGPQQRRAGQSVLPLGEWTPLMYAARENALDAGKALIDGGANLDLADPDGATALVIAIINAHYEFAAMLLRAGADPNVVDTRPAWAPLYAAVDMHRLAVGHGRRNPRPVGLLGARRHRAAAARARRGSERGAQKPIMQRQHTFGDGTLGEGATPLMRAAKSGDIELVSVLLAAGRRCRRTTMPNGATALMYAAGFGWRNGSPLAPSYDQGSDAEAVETIAFLLAQGLSLRRQDEDGNTALHAAVGGRGSEAIITYLVNEAHADPSIRNAKDQNVLEFAKAKRGGEALVALLESLGVDGSAPNAAGAVGD